MQFETEITDGVEKQVKLLITRVAHDTVEVNQLGSVLIDMQKVIRDAGLGHDSLLSQEGVRYTMPVDQCEDSSAWIKLIISGCQLTKPLITPRSQAAKKQKYEKLLNAMDLYVGPFTKEDNEETKNFKIDEVRFNKTETKPFDDKA